MLNKVLPIYTDFLLNYRLVLKPDRFSSAASYGKGTAACFCRGRPSPSIELAHGAQRPVWVSGAGVAVADRAAWMRNEGTPCRSCGRVKSAGRARALQPERAFSRISDLRLKCPAPLHPGEPNHPLRFSTGAPQSRSAVKPWPAEYLVLERTAVIVGNDRGPEQPANWRAPVAVCRGGLLYGLVGRERVVLVPGGESAMASESAGKQDQEEKVLFFNLMPRMRRAA